MLNHYPDVLTVEQAAHILCVSEKSLYRLLRDGAIGCKRIGRKYLIPKLCVADYLCSARYAAKR